MYLFHLTAIFLAAGLAYGQLPDIPQCALQCFVTALTQDGCSQLTDFACHCQKPQLVGSVTPCVQQNCPDINQQASVSNVVVSQCSQVGHPISVPPVKPTTTAAATTTPAPTGATTPTPSPTKTTPIPTAPAPPPPSSPAAPSGPPSPMPPHPSASGTSTGAGATGTSPGGGPVYTGAAVSWENNVAGAVVAAAAAVYIL
ncbi:CFEM domain-containing protein [Aspergillus floccosus]